MSCYHPLKAFPIGKTASGKVDYKITSYRTDLVYNYKGKWIALPEGKKLVRNVSETVDEFIEIPCGRCIGCRLQYSRDWANRCMLEASQHKNSYFITLTYDDDHVPTVEHVDSETGLISELGNLKKKDLSNFIKMLRQKLDAEDKGKIRFFGCGEYGENTARPHFHLIVFGLDLDDLNIIRHVETNGSHYNLYTSDTIGNVWKKGHIIIGDVTWETCAYVARYVTKKKYGAEADFYDEYGITPEFTLMSRRPGIGKDYYDTHKDSIFEVDYIPLKGGKRAVPSRYFKKLLEIDDNDKFNELRLKNREFAEDFNKFKLESTSQSYLEMLETEEAVLQNKVKTLVREL